MLKAITKGLSKVFGTKSDRDIKKLLPYVTNTNAEYAKLTSISDDELRGKTDELRNRINTQLESIDKQIDELNKKAQNDESLDVHQREEIFDQVDKLEEERNKDLEKVLIEILPEAFAIVKETARRLKENKKLEVNAEQWDHQIAAKKDNVEILSNKAIWHNSWIAAGNEMTWEMLHYDVQIIGGAVLHEGKISEMQTGEGKTLVATFPAFLNALANRGVHIVTVNDYLAKRDSEWMAPLFEFHKMSVDCVDKYQPNSEERRNAYQANITYGTNNEFGFDYLRDNMARDTEELVQKRHHFAIVDEVDSVLVDEARTPLIISGPVPRGDEQQYYELKPIVMKLMDGQKKIITDFFTQAKSGLQNNIDDKDAGLALFRAYRGLPKHKPLIKFLSEQGMRAALQKTENFYLQDNQKQMPEADKPLLFTIDEKNNQVDLTDAGIKYITKDGEDSSFFVLPDIGSEMAKIENDSSLSEQEQIEKKDELAREYSIKADRIHTLNQLLKAYTLFEKDVEYIIEEAKVKIVDEQTGRVMDGRRYSDGLHQAIEAKENVKVEDATQTYATITLQNYFRMYHKLAGMTGTAETEAGEFWEIYKLDVVAIPTNKPIARDDREDKVYKTVREKFNAVIDEIEEMKKAGRPILVGTTSVEISEVLSRMLQMKNVKHQVLNAKQHAKEADVVAEAGKPGTVTIATNMAGRGTDIKLSDESKKAGGLAIIGTERHESRRIDRQLRGRSGRQGDPGSSQFFVSLEDNLMRLFGSEKIASWMDKMGLQEGEVIQHSMITKSIERAQRKVEENNFGIRKRLLEYDDVMNSQREVIYKRRRNALFGDRLKVDVLTMLYELAEETAVAFKQDQNLDAFKLNAINYFGIESSINSEDAAALSQQDLVDKLFNEVIAAYKRNIDSIREKVNPVIKNVFAERGGVVENIQIPITDGKKIIGVVMDLEEANNTDSANLEGTIEKFISLAIIDDVWKEHLREMDDLKQSVQTAVYEQKDPLLIYKMEAFELFKGLMYKISQSVVSFLMKAQIPVENSSQVQEARQQRAKQKLNEQKDESGSILQGPRNNDTREVQKTQPIKSDKVFGRNDRVSVQYQDGSMKENVKFKSVEEDIKNNKCVLIDEN